MRLLALLLFAAAAFAGHVDADLVCATETLAPGEPARLGIRLRMEPGWHVYWRNPGDAGMACGVAWELPAGWAAGPVQWPLPHRLVEQGLGTYVYEGEVLLAVTLEVPAGTGAGPVTLAAKVEWLVCADVCFPGEARIELTLPVAPGAPRPDARWRALFAEADRALPRPAPRSVAAFREGERILLRVPREPAEFFAAEGLLIEHAAPQMVQRDGGGALLALVPARARTEPLRRLRGVLALGTGDAREALTVDVAVGPRPRPPPPMHAALLWMAAGAVALGWVFRRWRRLE